MKRWTKKELDWVRANAHLGEPGLAKALGIEQKQIRSMLRNHRIRTGNSSRFQKGMNPWNAGKHIRMSPGSEFKKGMLPGNTLHDGAITIRKDHSGTPYKFIRLAMTKWVHLHRHVWVQNFGPIPADMLIRFRNGDTMNCSPENLMLISKRENLRMNYNRSKVNASLKESWENGSRYENDQWLAKLLARGDRQMQQQILQDPQLLEVKRQQLLLRRKLKNHESFNQTERSAG